jgi:predicted small integral membrane protein
MVRLAKAVMCLALAGFALLVAADNVIDYATNYTFVQHVLSMDTTLPENGLMSRAITDPKIWQGAYVLIIAGEALTGVLLLMGSLILLIRLDAPAERFAHGKAWIAAGALVGFLVWFVGFMAIGGEWFQMWQSEAWNGQEAAFRFYITLLAVLIFVLQSDPEPRQAPK